MSVIVVCVVVIACANVSSLLVSRALEERFAFAIRASLGAGRARLVRLMVLQHGILVMTGGVLGVLVALFVTAVLRSASAFQSLQLTGMEYRLDGRVLAVSVVIAVAVTALISIVPTDRKNNHGWCQSRNVTSPSAERRGALRRERRNP